MLHWTTAGRLGEIEDNAEHHAVFRRRLCLSNSIARKLSGNAVWVSVRAFLADQRFPGRYSSGSSVWSTTHSDPHYRPAHCVTPWDDDLVLQFEFCSETAWNVAEQKETRVGGYMAENATTRDSAFRLNTYGRRSGTLSLSLSWTIASTNRVYETFATNVFRRKSAQCPREQYHSCTEVEYSVGRASPL